MRGLESNLSFCFKLWRQGGRLSNICFSIEIDAPRLSSWVFLPCTALESPGCASSCDFQWFQESLSPGAEPAQPAPLSARGGRSDFKIPKNSNGLNRRLSRRSGKLWVGLEGFWSLGCSAAAFQRALRPHDNVNLLKNRGVQERALGTSGPRCGRDPVSGRARMQPDATPAGRHLATGYRPNFGHLCEFWETFAFGRPHGQKISSVEQKLDCITSRRCCCKWDLLLRSLTLWVRRAGGTQNPLVKLPGARMNF